MSTFHEMMTEQNSRELAVFYLIEAEKLRESEELGTALACIANGRTGLALACIRRLTHDLSRPERPTLDTLANSAGYTYDLLQAYACLFIANQLEADRVLGTTRNDETGGLPLPYPFTGDHAANSGE